MGKITDRYQRVARRLKLRDLDVFSTVAECGGMAKAAARLHVSPPAVSQVISDLEQSLGVKLFDRTPQGVEPTRYGKALLRGGLSAFDTLQQTIKEIEFLADPTVGEVRIGCPEVVAVLLPRVIQSMSRRHPGIVVQTIDVSAPTLDLPQVRDRSIDLAIVRVTAPPSRLPIPDDLDVEVLLNDETVVVAGRDSPWARYRKINIAELAAERWILPPPETLNSIVVMEAFREAGAEQPIVSLVTFSIQLRINLVADGSCITVLPRSMLRLYGSRLPVKVLPVKLPDREWPVVMATLKNRTPDPITMLFKEHLRNNLNPA
jgi:DNA-binding transcriptional LysR family regulator